MIPKNFCRVIPALIARNPFLIEELTIKRPKKQQDIELAYKQIRRKIIARIEHELLAEK
jgi:hypothetical protein